MLFVILILKLLYLLIKLVRICLKLIFLLFPGIEIGLYICKSLFCIADLFGKFVELSLFFVGDPLHFLSILKLDLCLKLCIIQSDLKHINRLRIRVSDKRDQFHICEESCKTVRFQKHFKSGLVLIFEHYGYSVCKELLLIFQVLLSLNEFVQCFCFLIKSSHELGIYNLILCALFLICGIELSELPFKFIFPVLKLGYLVRSGLGL